MQAFIRLPIAAALLVRPRAYLVVVLGFLLISVRANGNELVINGGFESNGGAGSTSLSGWNQASQNSNGAFYAQTGVLSPLSAVQVDAPPAGAYAAMTDQSGPSSQVLYQEFTLPIGVPSRLSLRLFISNQATEYDTAASLDAGAVPNQQVRVDVMRGGSDSFDVGTGVLQNLFNSQTGDNPYHSYFPISADLSAYAGQTVRLRIAEVDNLQGLNVGIDQVSLITGTLTNTSYVDASPAEPAGAVISSVVSSVSGWILASSQLLGNPPGSGAVPSSAPPGQTFLHGLYAFTLTNGTHGSSATMTITYPSALPAGTRYWKYGPTAQNTVSHWYVIPAIVAGNTITFTLFDGGLGDDDLTADGTIIDVGGPAIDSTPNAIPSLSTWAVVLLGLLLAVLPLFRLRR